MLVFELSRLHILSDVWHEQGEHELVSELIRYLSQVFLSAHRNIVLGNHLIDQLLAPFLNLVFVDLSKHPHVSWYHVSLEIFAFSYESMMLMADTQDTRKGSCS